MLKHEADVLARKFTSRPPRSLFQILPSNVTSPAVGLSKPAMIEMRVVLPQPDGPTSSVISPVVHLQIDASQRQHRVSPLPNSFVTRRQSTAMLDVASVS